MAVNWDDYTPVASQPAPAASADNQAPPATDWSQFTPVTPQRRSGVGEIASQFKAGAMVDVPGIAGHALQSGPLFHAAGDFEPGHISAYGSKLVSEAQARGEQPEYKAEPEKHGPIVNALAQGARIIPLVAAPIAAAALAPAGAIGTAAGALAGAIPFALAAGHETLEKARAKGVPQHEALAAARESARNASAAYP